MWVGADEPFAGRIELSLIEVDDGEGNDDLLGTYEILEQEAGFVRKATFDALSNAHYTLEYLVTD